MLGRFQREITCRKIFSLNALKNTLKIAVYIGGNTQNVQCAQGASVPSPPGNMSDFFQALGFGQRHGLAVPRAGDRFCVTGSIRGWSRSHLTYVTGGC